MLARKGDAEASGGCFAHVLRALGNPLEWTDVEKSVLLFLPPVPFVLFYIARIEKLLRHPEFEPYIDRPTIQTVRWMLFGFLAMFLALFVVWLRLRRSSRPHAWFVATALQAWFIGMAVSSYAVGPFSSPVLVGYLAGGMTAFLLFDASRAWIGSMSGTAVLVGSTLLERAGALPYGPVFMGVAFGGRRPPDVWVYWNLAFTVTLTSFVLAATGFIMSLARRRQEEIRTLLRIDPLTGLVNRRTLDATLEHECSRARRSGEPLTVVMLDLDHFKRVNDTHGHAVGDQVLAAAAEAVRASLRDVDIASRYGGEEVLLVLPGTDLEGARIAADRVREAVAALEIVTDGGARVVVTASAGCATFDPNAGASITSVLKAADDALYRAKQAGRNRVELAPLAT